MYNNELFHSWHFRKVNTYVTEPWETQQHPVGRSGSELIHGAHDPKGEL